MGKNPVGRIATTTQMYSDHDTWISIAVVILSSPLCISFTEFTLSDAFGEKVRARRIAKGLTLDALAERIGSTKAYVWQLENKRPAKPSGELLLKLAEVLDVSAEFLIDDSNAVPTERHVQIALARGLAARGLSQDDLDKLFRIADTIRDGKNPKGSKQDY